MRFPWGFSSPGKRFPSVIPQRSCHGTFLEPLPFFCVFVELWGPEMATLWSPHFECSLLANFLPILQSTHPLSILPACPIDAVCLVCNFRVIFTFSLKPLSLALQRGICLQYSEVKRWATASVSWVINPSPCVEMFLGFKFFFGVCFDQYWNS